MTEPHLPATTTRDDETPLVEVLAVLGALGAVGCRVWVEGGWGVDALAGRQTRPHRDLDLAVEAGHEAAVLAALAGLGYAVETDHRPVRVELHAPGRGRVDLHPIALDAEGNGVQAGWDGATFAYPREGFGEGELGGERVPCLTAAQQVAFHAGYEPREIDRHDLAVLGRLGSGDTPEEDPT